MPKALTNIQVGLENGEVKLISAGEEVSGIDSDTMKQLVEAGAVEGPEGGDAPKAKAAPAPKAES